MSDAKFIGTDKQLCNALRHMADNRPITKAEKAIVREAADRIAQARREALEEAAAKAKAVKDRCDEAMEKFVMSDSIIRMSSRADAAEQIEETIRALIDKEASHD